MENIIEILSNTKLFACLTEEEIRMFLKSTAATIKNYESDQIVFMSGTPAKYTAMILSGQVQIIKEDFYGNRNILAHVNKGEIFGEAFACAKVSSLPVSVLTSKPSEILLVDPTEIFSSSSAPTHAKSIIINNMLKIMADKNIMLNQKIEFLSKRTTKEKLLAYLSSQADKAGSRSFTIPFNRQQLADFLSVDRSAMSSELCKLRDAGVIEFHKNNFTLK